MARPRFNRALARSACLAGVIGGALLSAPASAGAVTCERNSGLLSVELDTNDLVSLTVSSGNIEVRESGSLVPCANGPTTSNVGAIAVSDPPGATSASVMILEAGDFAPGAALQDGSDSGGGTPEIETYITLDDASFSRVRVGDRGGHMRFGSSGINPNARPEEGRPDADIFVQGADGIDGLGANTGGITDPVVLGAQGGAGTGNPLTAGIELLGNRGNDDLTGGDGPDYLWSFEGQDSLVGGRGNDTLQPEEDADFISGGDGVDTLNYLVNSNTASLAVDLAFSGPQNTGPAGTETIVGVENVDATPGPDILRGDGGPNELFTSNGNDVIDGRGGIDAIRAGIGADSVDVRDGGPDTVECGDGVDDVLADAPGVDTLSDCEEVTFAAAPGPGGGGAGGGGGGDTPRPTTFGADVLVTLRLARSRIPARGPVPVRVANANGFPIVGTLSGRTVRRVAMPRRRRLGLPAKPFLVGPQAARTVRLKLSRRLRRALVRSRKVAFTMTAQVTDTVGNSRIVRKRLTPRLRR